MRLSSCLKSLSRQKFGRKIFLLLLDRLKYFLLVICLIEINLTTNQDHWDINNLIGQVGKYQVGGFPFNRTFFNLSLFFGNQPNTLQQNGIAEWKNRTLKEMVNSMLVSSRAPQNLWEKALLSANYILNRVSHKKLNLIPFQLWHWRAPSYHYLKIWEYLAGFNTLT